MSFRKHLTGYSLALATLIGGISIAQADMYTDRMKADQSAKSKSQQ